MPIHAEAVIAMATDGRPALVAEGERVEVACRIERGAPSCTMHATHRLRNTGRAAEHTTLYVYGARVARVRVDGRDALGTNADTAATAAIDARVRGRAGIETTVALRRSAFAIEVAPGASASLSVDAAIDAVDERGGPSESYAIPAVRTRHPQLGSDDVPDRVTAFRVYPLTDDATIHTSASAAIESATWTPGPRGVGSWFDVVTAGRRFWNGGPMIGIGGSLERAATRARLGYEVAFPSSSTLLSLAADSDFKSRSTVAALYEVASPSAMLVIPSVGAGVGVPVEFRSGSPARVGVRLQVTISFPVLSIVVPLDNYFAGDGAIEAAILAQISL